MLVGSEFFGTVSVILSGVIDSKNFRSDDCKGPPYIGPVILCTTLAQSCKGESSLVIRLKSTT